MISGDVCRLLGAAHRVSAAWRAISERRAAESFRALAAPPLRPPRRPSSTAAGSFKLLKRSRTIGWEGMLGVKVRRRQARYLDPRQRGHLVLHRVFTGKQGRPGHSYAFPTG